MVFSQGKVFLSYTNPTNPGDPTLVHLTNGGDPDGPLKTKPILDFGDKGLNLETGKTEIIPQNDPDSLKLAPNGDLLLASGSDQVIIDVHNAGTSHQSVTFTKVQGVPAQAGLDDVLKVDAHAGTFYISDTADNRVLTVHATDLNTNDYFASIGNAFGAVDPTTGKFTALVSASDAPGFKFGSAHGAAFVADQSSVPAAVAANCDGFVFSGTSHFNDSLVNDNSHVIAAPAQPGVALSQVTIGSLAAEQSNWLATHDASQAHWSHDLHGFHLV